MQGLRKHEYRLELLVQIASTEPHIEGSSYLYVCIPSSALDDQRVSRFRVSLAARGKKVKWVPGAGLGIEQQADKPLPGCLDSHMVMLQ